ncbi:MAG TPA: LLM class flavin-dependent oxidoreductase [Thermomicrobiales bacterium]|nr:LLM class flavin-dependent oxidoreductase [Thermomicrobiales bacterium]
MTTGSAARSRRRRERVGFNVRRKEPTEALGVIKQAEDAGVDTIWMTMSSTGVDTLTLFAAAAMRAERVRLGTSIVPAFTRHPLSLATQALALHDLAPGRVRLGIGTSHGPSFAKPYGLSLDRPIERFREYLQVARPAIHEGRVAFSGEFYQVDATLPHGTDVPLLVSALRQNAWELAGELSDGGISWLCPVDFLLDEALPAMQRGAERAGRETPPLIAHVPVALMSDRADARAAMRSQLPGYGRLPFYARMFAASGYPVGPNGEYSDALLDRLVVSGSDQSVAAQLTELLDRGLDELLVMLVHGPDQPAEEDRLMRLLSRL